MIRRESARPHQAAAVKYVTSFARILKSEHIPQNVNNSEKTVIFE